jgi:hypothetical protein
MHRTASALLILALGCSDYEFHVPKDGSSPLDDGDELVEGEGPDEGSADDTDYEPDQPDPYNDEDCLDGVWGDWLSGEIYVFSWDRPTDSGVLVAPEAGWFHLYDTSIAESGSSQWNESVFLRVSNGLNPDGMPLDGNCEGDFVIVDPDNEGALPDGTTVFLGTFLLEAGENDVSLHHFCPRYRDGECTDLHDAGDPNSTCDTGNVNSAHVVGESICLVKA